MSHPFEEKFKDRSSKEKLRLYHLYNGFITYLNQTLTKAMEKSLYELTDDTHCFMVTLKDSGKYILVEDYFQNERISTENIFKFAEEYNLRLESINHEVSEGYDDLSREHYVSKVNHYTICYEILK